MPRKWSSLRTSTYQMSNFNVNDHIQFDQNTGNLTTSTGSGQALGYVHIPGGYPDLQFDGNVTMSVPPGEPDTTYLSFQWYNTTTSSWMGTEGTYTFSRTGENKNAVAYTGAPVSAIDVVLRITGKQGNINSVFGSATVGQIEFIGVEPGGGGGGGGASNHVFAEASRITSFTVAPGVEIIVDYNNVVYDNYSSLTTGVDWTFNTLYSGTHLVRAGVKIQDWNQEEDEKVELRLYKNGSFYCVLDTYTVFLPKTWGQTLHGSYPLMLADGDTVKIKLYNGTASTLTVSGDSVITRAAIVRVKE